MKYYQLFIDFEESWNTFDSISNLLNVTPEKHSKNRLDKSDIPSTWFYQIEVDEEIECFDFVNNFLGLIEPNIESLSKLGIKTENMLIWLVYEYTEQCSLSFNSQELKRLGQSGISFNIDCHKKSG